MVFGVHIVKSIIISIIKMKRFSYYKYKYKYICGNLSWAFIAIKNLFDLKTIINGKLMSEYIESEGQPNGGFTLILFTRKSDMVVRFDASTSIAHSK